MGDRKSSDLDAERPPKMSVASKEVATHDLQVFYFAFITLDSRSTIFGLVAIFTHCPRTINAYTPRRNNRFYNRSPSP